MIVMRTMMATCVQVERHEKGMTMWTSRNVRRGSACAGLVGVAAGAFIALGAANSGPTGDNPGVLVSVRMRTECVAETETEVVYRHVKGGAYVAYSPAKVEHTASENHGTVCKTETTKRYEK